MARSVAQVAKAAGLRSLTQMAEMTGYSSNHLRNLYRNNIDRFEILLLGCVAKRVIDSLQVYPSSRCRRPVTSASATLT